MKIERVVEVGGECAVLPCHKPVDTRRMCKGCYTRALKQIDPTHREYHAAKERGDHPLPRWKSAMDTLYSDEELAEIAAETWRGKRGRPSGVADPAARWLN